MSPEAVRSRRYRFGGFLVWLRGQPGWGDATPEGLLEFQEGAVGRQRYELLNLIQRYVKEMGGTRMGMIARYSTIRSFFLHNRVELPKDAWDPGSGTREPSRGRLNIDGIHRVVEAAGLRDRAIFLTLFQGLMDQERFMEFNLKHAGELVEHLRKQGVEKPFRVDFMKGRKKNHNPFYTFLGRDALAAWQEYFEKERGWPKPNEPIAVVRGGTRSPTKQAIRYVFETLSVRLKLRPKNPGKGDRGHRTGVNLHEFRDVARSHLQTAKRDGLDETCIEFWMGHRVDPLAYNKFAELEQKYVADNYRIAERYLNILSTPLESETAKEQNERIAALEKQIAEMRQTLERARSTIFTTMQQLEPQSRGPLENHD